MAITALVWVLVSLAAAVALAGVAGMLWVRTSYDRLHLLGPVGLVSAPLIAVAVVLQQGHSADAIKAVMVALILMVTGPAVAHALGHAIRVQHMGGRTPAEKSPPQGARP